MNLLIAQGGKLGDMVCTTPMFRAIKEAHPEWHLTVMGSALNGEVLKGNPYIDEYLVSPDSVSDFVALLRPRKIDAAVLAVPMPNILKALMYLWIPKIVVPRIVGGWSPMVTRSYRLLSLFATRIDFAFGEYVPGLYLKLLEPLGIYTTDTRKDLFIEPSAEARMRALLPRDQLLVGIAPGVGNGRKTWGGTRFATVANELALRHDIVVVIFGGERDRVEVSAMRGALATRVRVIDLAEKTSIEELKGAIKCLNMLISVDSGPIYVAEALAVPTVDNVGPMDQGEQPPRGPRHRVVVPPGNPYPAIHILNATVVDDDEVKRQVDAVTPDMVIAAADSLIKDLKAGVI